VERVVTHPERDNERIRVSPRSEAAKEFLLNEGTDPKYVERARETVRD
jgi:hypothetical protein